MHYVIGDVHGCYDELMLLLQKIEAKDKDARYIFVGDFIDRGKQVWDVLKWVMENITPDGKYQSVRGNHEQMVLEWYGKWLEWLEKGGNVLCKVNPVTFERMPETYYDFSGWLDARDYLHPEKLEPVMKFFHSLPYSKDLTVSNGKKQVHYKIVHAWHDYNETSIETQEHNNIWARCYSGNWVSEDIIVHGHTPTCGERYIDSDKRNVRPGMINYRRNSINVDGGCVFTSVYPLPCMLCAICLETLEEIYHCTLEERFLELSCHRLSVQESVERAQKYRKKYLKNENFYRNDILERLGQKQVKLAENSNKKDVYTTG